MKVNIWCTGFFTMYILKEIRKEKEKQQILSNCTNVVETAGTIIQEWFRICRFRLKTISLLNKRFSSPLY